MKTSSSEAARRAVAKPRIRARVLVVEDEDYVRESLLALLASRGFETTAATSSAQALSILAKTPVDVVLSDLRMPGGSGLDLVRRLQSSSPETPVVILTGHGHVASAVECLRAGASDYILKPADPEALEVALERAIETRALRREVRYLRSAESEEGQVPAGESAVWRRLLSRVDAAAPTDSTVLLLGESGTGKELLARRIHQMSARAAGPFIRVNCAAIPLEIWESEFFGHRKGSFTGAAADREGRFQLAHRGTLLLDEVGAMPAAGQAKLLRVIQDGEFDRLGDEQPTRVDVRIVASTNSDLEAEVKAGRFRADLFYRLNVVRIDVPPLRERTDDIPLLTQLFVRHVASRLGRPAPEVEAATMARLRAYSWPGNVRELKSVIERALVLDPVNGLAGADMLPGLFPPSAGEVTASELNLREATGRLERDLILEAERRSNGVRKETARLLGIDPRNLGYYFRKHGLAAEGGDELASEPPPG
jgi:two-component system, NtrC family, response regulator AtoC